MTTLAEVHAGLADAVSTVLNCDPYESDKINVPGAQVVAPPYDPRMVFSGGKTVYPFKVRVYGSRTIPEATFEAMCAYREASGTKSLVAAIQDGDNWPDDLVDYAQVQQVGEFQSIEIPAGQGAWYLAFEIDVEVCF
jgi:hypothetical protein